MEKRASGREIDEHIAMRMSTILINAESDDEEEEEEEREGERQEERQEEREGEREGERQEEREGEKVLLEQEEHRPKVTPNSKIQGLWKRFFFFDLFMIECFSFLSSLFFSSVYLLFFSSHFFVQTQEERL